MATLSTAVRDKLSRRNFGFLATLMADGWPHVSPVWVDVEDDRILVNTSAGRVKERNIRRDPRVGLSIAEADDPYDKVDIRGRVVEVFGGEEAREHIHALNRKYHQTYEPYPLRPGEERFILHIEPTVAAGDR